MTKGYKVFVSEDARREHEKQPKQAKRRKDCPSCEIKAEVININDITDIKNDKEGDKE